MDQLTLDYYSRHAGEVAARYAAAGQGVDRFFGQAFAPGSSVLDVGCGPGRDVNRLLERGYDAFGLDACRDLLAAARRLYPGACGRLFVEALPSLSAVRDAAVDGVLCSAVLMHLPRTHLAQACAALVRVTRRGGSILVSTPADQTGVDPFSLRDEHGRLFSGVSPHDLERCFAAAGARLVAQWRSEDSLNRAHRGWHTLMLTRER